MAGRLSISSSGTLNWSWRANIGGSTKEYKEYTVKRTVLEKFSTFADSKEQAKINIQNCVVGPYEVLVLSETCVRKKPQPKITPLSDPCQGCSGDYTGACTGCLHKGKVA